MESTKAATKASVVRTVDKHLWKKTFVYWFATAFLTVVVIGAATISIISSTTGEKADVETKTVDSVGINIDVDGKHFHLNDDDLSAKPGDSIKVHVTHPSAPCIHPHN